MFYFAIMTYKHDIYELPQELRLKEVTKLENIRKVSKPQE